MSVGTIGLLVGGLVLLLLGGSALVRGAADLARAAGLSPLLIGITVVAFGTSAPELAASVVAALRGQGDVALGNVVGSNVLNVLLILGASALVAPLVVAQKLIRVDIPLMVVLSVAVAALGADGRVGRLDGLLLLAAFLGYTVYAVRSARREPDDVRSEYEQAFGEGRPRERSAISLSVGRVLAGLLLLVVGSRLLVGGAVAIARALGVGELLIGLTVVAAGTSLPEVATSILAAWRGERDIAVGNIVGSCIFNLLAVLGLAAALTPGGVPVAPSALRFDMPVMIAAAAACVPIAFTGHRVARWEGALLLGYYVAYVGFLVLGASAHDRLPALSTAMLAFVIPLTVLTLGVSTVRELRRVRGAAPSRDPGGP